MLKKPFPLPTLPGRQQELNKQISDQVISIQVPQQIDLYKLHNIHICSHYKGEDKTRFFFYLQDTARSSQELLDGKKTFNTKPGEQHSCCSKNTIKASLGQLHNPTNLIVLNTKKEILVLMNPLTNSLGFKGSGCNRGV